MNMKVNKYILIGVAGLMMTGCNDSFLDRYPEDAISEKNFFKTVADLKTYTYSLYDWPASTTDGVSDNVIYCEASGVFDKMLGKLTPEEADQWGWGDIRSINFFLCRANQATGDRSDINHYIGLGRLYRAKAYYSKVQSYSDVPWYNRDLQTTDIEELYKPQDPRSVVVDSIMNDLEFAVTNMKDGNSKTEIYKVVALAEQARIALNEGTFRKYHPELELDDYDRFLTLAKDASQAIIDNYDYKISNTPSGNLPPYRALFSSQDLSTNSEIILMQDNDKALGRLYGISSIFNYNHSISRSLMEDYLVKTDDGRAVPFHTIPGAETKEETEIFENRDPRMAETIMPMGWKREWDEKPQRQKMEMGGYPQVKFCRDTPKDMWEWGTAYNDLPIIRYATILLINAEAKAELGILTQDDIDNTINQLRRRVEMPDAKLSEWLSNPDPVQMQRYSNIRSTQAGAVAEIRRERRIELACEGQRYNDLMRWGLGKLLEKAPEGAYIPNYGYYDTNGDGIMDAGFFPNEEEKDKAFEQLTPEDQENVTSLILDSKSPIVLSEGDKGYIVRVSQVNAGWEWVEPKYYYSPVATKDIVINPNLVQNKFWK